jgi:thioesterase domain-containing protein
MTGLAQAVLFFPGAGGGPPNLAAFRAGPDDVTLFEAIEYPGWRRYVADDFSPEALIAELTAQVVIRVPEGPIRIVGLSIGGHFGYAVALRLQALGREIASFCAIDSFMIASSKPSSGWQRRALARAQQLLRERRLGMFVRFARSLFWRALLRLGESRLAASLRKVAPSGQSLALSRLDPIFEMELSMRLLLRGMVPWIASLDHAPAALEAPSILLRTRLTARDDPAWRRRCPRIRIFEILGEHQRLFEPDTPENIASLHQTFIDVTGDWRQTCAPTGHAPSTRGQCCTERSKTSAGPSLAIK